MDAARAEEIIKSPAIIEVRHRNTAVWLEEVNTKENTAIVTYMSLGGMAEVPISQLSEQSAVKAVK